MKSKVVLVSVGTLVACAGQRTQLATDTVEPSEHCYECPSGYRSVSDEARRARACYPEDKLHEPGFPIGRCRVNRREETGCVYNFWDCPELELATAKSRAAYKARECNAARNALEQLTSAHDSINALVRLGDNCSGDEVRQFTSMHWQGLKQRGHHLAAAAMAHMAGLPDETKSIKAALLDGLIFAVRVELNVAGVPMTGVMRLNDSKVLSTAPLPSQKHRIWHMFFTAFGEAGARMAYNDKSGQADYILELAVDYDQGDGEHGARSIELLLGRCPITVMNYRIVDRGANIVVDGREASQDHGEGSFEDCSRYELLSDHIITEFLAMTGRP